VGPKGRWTPCRLGVAVSKNLRRWLLKLHSDPRQAIEAEITELKGLLDKYKA
jgi:hypothetical protein